MQTPPPLVCRLRREVINVERRCKRVIQSCQGRHCQSLKGAQSRRPSFLLRQTLWTPPFDPAPWLWPSLAHLRVHEVDRAYPEVPLLQLVDKGAQNRHVRVELDLARAIEDLHPAKAQTVSQFLSVAFRLLLPAYVGAALHDNCRILDQLVSAYAATLLRECHSLLAQRQEFVSHGACYFEKVFPWPISACRPT
jgi:hypothetical protein